MKCVFIADLHLGSSRCGSVDHQTALHTREIDFLRSLDLVIDFALDPLNKIEFFGFLGDFYEDRKPSMIQQREIARRIKRLSSAKMNTILLKGNHDLPEGEGAHTSAVVKEFEIPYITIVDEPQILHFDKLSIVAMPYVSQRRLRFKTLEETAVYYQETVKSLRALSGQKQNICIGHQTVENAVMPAGYRDLATMNEVVVPINTFKDFDASIFGHIHKCQTLGKDPFVIYVGSPDRVDFGEADEEKGFILYDSDTKKTNFVKIKVRDFLDSRIDVSDIDSDKIQEKIDQYVDVLSIEDKITKLTIKIKDIDIGRIDIAKLNTFFKKSFYFAGVNYEVIREKRLRNEDIKEGVSATDTLKSYVSSKPEYQKVMNLMLTKGQEIIEKVNSQ